MLLLRIAQHVKAQNWTVGGVDFLIVVFTLFFGIPIVNRSDAR